MPIVTIGLSHRSAPVDVREKFAFKESEIPEVLGQLRARGLITEGVILSTCNRVELYAVTHSADAKSVAELRALLSRGAKSIIVANRSFDRAATLAADLGGRAVSFDDWFREFERVDIIISSTSAPHYILDKAKVDAAMKLRHHRPLLLIDIA